MEALKDLDWSYYWLIFTTVVTCASMVAAATKNKWDDKWVGKLVAFLALNRKG